MVEYRGTFFYPENIEESYAQESKYYEDPETGSYMYWFDYKGKKYCIDATAESPFYGRLLNHSCKVPNCATKPLDVRFITHERVWHVFRCKTRLILSDSSFTQKKTFQVEPSCFTTMEIARSNRFKSTHGSSSKNAPSNELLQTYTRSSVFWYGSTLLFFIFSHFSESDIVKHTPVFIKCWILNKQHKCPSKKLENIYCEYNHINCRLLLSIKQFTTSKVFTKILVFIKKHLIIEIQLQIESSIKIILVFK